MEAAADAGNLKTELSGAGAPGSERANPIALEVRVNATGARPNTGTEKRELFSEDTQTALVFPDGAVIALSAAVVPGQLVFLTNKENNREVVCQVVRKKNNRPTSCYVELQFTEPQKDFWDVVFPERPDGATVQQMTRVEESVASAEVTEEPAAMPVEEPNSEEVEALRQEVDVLREQLKALTEARKKEEEEAKKAAEEATRKAQEEADAAIAALAAKRAAAANPVVRMNLPVAAETPATMPTKGMAAGMDQTPTTAEKARHPEGREAFEDLLPQPELDFSHTPIPMKRPEEDDPNSIYKPLRRKAGLKDVAVAGVVTVLLVGGIGAAWYKDLLPMARRKTPNLAASTKSGSPVKSPAGASAPMAKNARENAATAVAATAGAGAASQPTNGAEEKNGSLAATAKDAASAGDDNRGGTASASGAGDSSRNESASEEPVAMKKTASIGKSAAAGPAKKRGTTKENAAPVAVEPEPPADAPLEPAKLVRAAMPVYPPSAMRSFITGDVRISAEVEANGRVGKVTVISGPKALRDAAVEAMKQYEYEPATKSGKAVASQVTVTIKFWFDP